MADNGTVDWQRGEAEHPSGDIRITASPRAVRRASLLAGLAASGGGPEDPFPTPTVSHTGP
ncbi:MAG: hypothetical protein HOV78_17680 [Hamadaea sp.]|nr:hypothetical protein [Hamadaea sp.]NUT05937.1 hypothetical protein [Hamadaea sp.]